MIKRGKELIRICPTNPAKLEYSTSNGGTWCTRFQGNASIGNFSDLMDNGKEILGMTNKGLFYSTSNGGTWILRRR